VFDDAVTFNRRIDFNNTNPVSVITWLGSNASGTVDMQGQTFIGAKDVSFFSDGGGKMLFSGQIIASGGRTITIDCQNGYVEFSNTSNTIINLIVTQGGFGFVPTASNLTVSGNLSFSSTDARLRVNTNGSTAASRINVTGTTALGGAVIDIISTLDSGTYTIISGTGTMSGSLPTLGTNNSGKSITIQQVGNDLQIVAA